MPKRIPIFTKALKTEIEIVRNKLNDDSVLIRNAITDIAEKLMIPPYPVRFEFFDELNAAYHISGLGLIVQSCVMQLEKDMREIRAPEWRRVTDRYLDIPKDSEYSSDGNRTGKQVGVEQVTLSDEVIDTSSRIGEYVYTYAQDIPQLKHSHGYSHKIVSHLAIIYTADLILNQTQRDNPVGNTSIPIYKEE